MKTRPKILLVDDDPAWLDTLSEYLRSQEFDVTTAPDGRRALGLVEDSSPAVVLIDVNMPGIGGFEFLRRTRRRGTVVLLMSGDDDPSLPAQARAEGACTLLSKTASPALLLRTVRQALAVASPGLMALLRPRRSDHLLPAPRKTK
jgi:two-component system chemotaxis response regulator CheY